MRQASARTGQRTHDVSFKLTTAGRVKFKSLMREALFC
jgi:hypothetical protein